MKKALIVNMFIALSMVVFSAANAYAMDYPHTDIGVSSPISCGDCHYNHGDPPWKPSSPANIDETFYNNQCLSCHDGSPGTDIKTHSSLQVDGSYGQWSIECWKCHDTHDHEQFDAYPTSSGGAYLDEGTVADVVSGNTVKDLSKNWSGEYDQSSDPGTYQYYYILIPDINYPDYNYKIISSTGTDLVIEGTVDTSKVTNGVSQYKIVYGRLVRSTIDAPDISSCEIVANEFICGSTIAKTIKYFDKTGPNSLADGDGTFDGICEACHTRTLYNRNDNVGAAHNTTLNCTTCHKHIEGFEINPATMNAGEECNNCHGYPPIESVPNSSSTGGNTGLADKNPLATTTNSATAGAHEQHAIRDISYCSDTQYTDQSNCEGAGKTWIPLTAGFSCGYCHKESAGYNAAHNSGGDPAVITMGFSLFKSVYEGGTYTGQSGVIYDATLTSPITDISTNDGNMTCTNVYCHSIVQSSSGGALITDTPDYASPQWDNSPIVQCGSCHKSDGVQGDASLMDSGTHFKHASSYACDNCHYNAGDGTSLHANGEIDVNFSDSSNPLGVYNNNDPNPPGGGYGNCSNLSCHGAGEPTWGGDPMTCGDCHLSGGSDVDDYSFDNGTLATISSSEWSWSGHGRTTGLYDVSLNPAANFPGAASSGDPCLYCHDSTINHNDGGNPFRLRNFDALGNGWNDVCLICHKSGQTTYDPDDAGPLGDKVATKFMNKYHDSEKYDTSPRDGGTLCFDCHDPHGDANIYMIHTDITVDKNDTDGLTPETTATTEFIDKVNGGSYAKENPGSPGTYFGVWVQQIRLIRPLMIHV
jgi:predicted CxxxxCH...CXXCH cytochrome family protein